MAAVTVELLAEELLSANKQHDPDELRGLASSTLARASRIAPCLVDPAFAFLEAATGVLVDVMQRRLDLRATNVVAGASSTRTRGDRSVTVDAKSVALVLFQPGDIAELQALCSSQGAESSTGGLPVGNFPPAQPWPC